MRNFLLLSTLCFSLLLSAQGGTEFSSDQSLNKIDAKGRKQGLWKKYDEKNVIVYTGQFKDDVPFGTFKYYYPFNDTNFVRCIMTFKPGGKEAFGILLHPNGAMMAKGKYLNQMKDSVWNYYDESGRLLSTDTYVKDKKNGITQMFYPGGQLMSKTTYKDDLKEGPFTEFFEDSKQKTVANYWKDMMDGKATYYFPNGKMAATGIYRNGLKHLIWNYNTAQGNPEPREVYNMGKLLEGKKAEDFLKNPVVEKKEAPKKGTTPKGGTPKGKTTGGTKKTTGTAKKP